MHVIMYKHTHTGTSVLIVNQTESHRNLAAKTRRLAGSTAWPVASFNEMYNSLTVFAEHSFSFTKVLAFPAIFRLHKNAYV